jgi:hypothetical protein
VFFFRTLFSKSSHRNSRAAQAGSFREKFEEMTMVTGRAVRRKASSKVKVPK